MASSLSRLSTWLFSGSTQSTAPSPEENPHFKITLTDTTSGKALPEYGVILEKDAELSTEIDQILETAAKTDKTAQELLTQIKTARLSLATALVHEGDEDYTEIREESSNILDSLRKRAGQHMEELGNSSPSNEFNLIEEFDKM